MQTIAYDLKPFYHTKILTPDHVGEVVALQQIVLKALPDSMKEAIVPKSAKEFEKRMTTLGTMYGVYTNTNQMIAYATLALPNESWPVADMELDPKNLICPPNQLGVIQNSVVHPAHRGQGIHRDLIKTRLELCLQLGRGHIMTEVAAFNPSSVVGHIKNGLYVVHATRDSVGCPLLFLYKNLKQPLKTAGKSPPIFINPEISFPALSYLLCQGYAGHKLSRVGKTKNYMLSLSIV